MPDAFAPGDSVSAWAHSTAPQAGSSPARDFLLVEEAVSSWT
jgi:hypothetical protein